MRLAPLPALLSLLLSTACVSTYQRVITPEELPLIEAQLEESPRDGPLLHRHAAALYAAGRCVDAQPAAARALEVEPDLALGVLVMGRCLEDAGDVERAIALYSRYVEARPRGRGVAAVAAQHRLALGRQAVELARAAVLAEQQGLTATTPPDPNAVAVLPLLVNGGPEYAPLSRGLASLMISDLFLLDRFRLLERIQLDAIVAELDLARSGAVDPATAAQVGRLMRAGRTVQGTITIDSTAADAALTAAVVGVDGANPEMVESAGGLEALLDLEKTLVLAVSEAMGYTPSLAERTRILHNGTRNLAAFLAYSQGLEAMALGDYAGAAARFEEAVRQDPGFEEARGQLGQARAVEIVARAAPGELGRVALESDAAVAEAQELGGFGGSLLGLALQTSVLEVAGLDQEFTTLAAQGPAPEQQLGSLAGSPSTQGPGGAPPTQTGEVRIIFVIP